MPIDLNELQRRLRQQNNVGVSRDGMLVPTDPRNDGNGSNSRGVTTLEPKKFFRA